MRIMLYGYLLSAFAMSGCFARGDDATSGDTPEGTSISASALSSVGGDITATEILDRARFWYQLCNDADKSDCTENQCGTRMR